MISVLLTVFTVLVGYGLGRGVPRLAQRSGGIVRRSRSGQLAMGLVLLIPWAVGGLALVMVLGQPFLWLPMLGYAAGMGWGRRKLGL